jgi:hypothetical protein
MVAIIEAAINRNTELDRDPSPPETPVVELAMETRQALSPPFLRLKPALATMNSS